MEKAKRVRFFLFFLSFSLSDFISFSSSFSGPRERACFYFCGRGTGEKVRGGGAPDFTEISAKTQETHSPLSFSFLSSSFFLLSLFLSLSLSIKKNEFRLSTPTAPGEEKLFPSSEDSVSPSLSSVDIDVFFL
jgi:hypothetical protein